MDFRRLNVAITRAKKKMIFIGSKSTLEKKNEFFKSFFIMLEMNEWILDLKNGDDNQLDFY
jgi:DNA replication ATP-dependent helicase Dna2